MQKKFISLLFLSLAFSFSQEQNFSSLILWDLETLFSMKAIKSTVIDQNRIKKQKDSKDHL